MNRHLPHHLKKYVSEQDYSKYTPENQATWRYIMRQLKSYLSTHAHPCYIEGLIKTGIEVERIPNITTIDKKLKKFGWGAIPVSGFIPPAAFMEFQALGFLPIASEIRTVDHILYTPAPDIVHEAAGHAPILIDPEFAKYLKSYASVASHAIISSEDMELYNAIRILSDIKEKPDANKTEIQQAEDHLIKVTNSLKYNSEASLLGRMNWWTAEYGLFGTVDKPLIYGAGLLSSVSEAKGCLSDKVTKVPFDINCLNYSYDITEPQPQLFVTPDFHTLIQTLKQFADTMAYRCGGVEGLEKIKKAQTVNTVEFNTDLQVAGLLIDYTLNDNGQPTYLQFKGPTQIAFNKKELEGHSKNYHKDGYGTPIGQYTTNAKLNEGAKVELQFESGITVRGTIKQLLTLKDQLKIITFSDCLVQKADKVLFQPEWGLYDMCLADNIKSVFGGPADRSAYGETTDFEAHKVPTLVISEYEEKKFELYQEIRNFRASSLKEDHQQINRWVKTYSDQFSKDWLIGLELYELTAQSKNSQRAEDIKIQLSEPSQNSVANKCIKDGLAIAHLSL